MFNAKYTLTTLHSTQIIYNVILAKSKGMKFSEMYSHINHLIEEKYGQTKIIQTSCSHSLQNMIVYNSDEKNCIIPSTFPPFLTPSPPSQLS